MREPIHWDYRQLDAGLLAGGAKPGQSVTVSRVNSAAAPLSGIFDDDLPTCVYRACPLPLWFLLAQSGRAETVLQLAETATVMAAPDEIVATLQAEATSASASDAQARVNAVILDALSRAHKVDGLDVFTGGYGVWRTGPTPTDIASGGRSAKP